MTIPAHSPLPGPTDNSRRDVLPGAGAPGSGVAESEGQWVPWSRSADDVLGTLTVRPDRGLTDAEVAQRRERYGANQLQEIQPRSPWLILLAQFRSLIVLLLAAAALVSLCFHEWLDALAVFVVILINALIGFFMELRAEKSVQALRRLGTTNATVRRNGRPARIPAAEMVPGDIALFEGGDVVSADIRLVRASRLQVTEAALTGESVPVDKETGPLDAECPLAERLNMLYKGTAVTRGSAEGVVVATGMATELGRISSLVEQAKAEATPLEKRLDALGRRLIWVTLLIAGITALLGIRSGKGLLIMIETAIALAVAAIPEGLPIVATIALAKGMHRMARRNALVNRLSSVETLGATGVICTDKTGTLTENRMAVGCYALDEATVTLDAAAAATDTPFRDGQGKAWTVDHPLLAAALRAGVLCNNASLRDEDGPRAEAVGDPLEVALLEAAARAGLDVAALRGEYPKAGEEAFDADLRMMATAHRQGEGFLVVVKGAAETVLDACSLRHGAGSPALLDEAERAAWLARNQALAEGGFRVLALAEKRVADPATPPYEGLTLIGLVGLLDPPRADVPEALARCRRAGIRVIMVTGDQPATARQVAETIGLVEPGTGVEVLQGRDMPEDEPMSAEAVARLCAGRLFARVSPKQKLLLIAAHQSRGTVVAMTGDGVNDAPALKKADIGVAMGLRGTDVAREAADMVLTDDAFPTIVAAVEQGRVIFTNIRKFVLFLMSCNLSEILVVGLAAAVNAPLPILPLQILFLNIVTDVFPALALGIGEGDPDVMRYPPRDPSEPVLRRQEWGAVVGYGLTMAVSVLAGFAVALRVLDLEVHQATTVSFLILAMAQLWHVFNMRSRGSGILDNALVRNRFLWGALVLCTGLLLAAVYLPGISTALKLARPGLSGWSLAVGLSLVPLVVGQTVKVLRRTRP
ncbi:MAG: HAD-IC family P-type ATPase [Lentisphaeria bacterium]|nr:HAD-IC family P-type ATPase [Lentisphaeria bacterium]